MAADGEFIPAMLGVSDSIADPQPKQLMIDPFCQPAQAHSPQLPRLTGSLKGSNEVTKPRVLPRALIHVHMTEHRHMFWGQTHLWKP